MKTKGKKPKGGLKSQKKPIVNNETFIYLMKVAREEPDIRNKLKSILKLDSFNRQSILNTWLHDLKLQGAPRDFIESLSYFLDDDIAEKALEIILEYEDA